MLLFFTRFKAYTGVSMKLFNGSHDDSLGANWKGSLQSLHNPLNFKINPLTLLTDGYRFLFILVLRIGIKSSCQEWYFKPITPDYVWNALDHVQTGSTFFKTYSTMFGIYSTTIRMWMAMFEPVLKYSPNVLGHFRAGYARLCSGYDYFRTAPLEGFVPFNSFILTQSRWYSVRHNAGFPQFLSISNSVSFCHVSISWPVCISFFSLINLTLVIIRQHDICLV